MSDHHDHLRRQHHHYYAVDAAELVETVKVSIAESLAIERLDVLLDLQELVQSIDLMLHSHLIGIIKTERERLLLQQGRSWIASTSDDDFMIGAPRSLKDCVTVLKSLTAVRGPTTNQEVARAATQRPRVSSPPSNAQQMPSEKALELSPTSSTTILLDPLVLPSTSASASKSACTVANQLMFRLIVMLQLVQVQLGDCNYVITGPERRRRRQQLFTTTIASSLQFPLVVAGVSTCLVGTGIRLTSANNQSNRTVTGNTISASSSAMSQSSGSSMLPQQILNSSSKVVIAAVVARYAYHNLARLWMKQKLLRSLVDLRLWQEQWLHFRNECHASSSSSSSSSSSYTSQQHNSQRWNDPRSVELITKAKQLHRHQKNDSSWTSMSSSLWQSDSDMRFFVVKRAMDLLYASVGTAVEVTGTKAADTSDGLPWQLSLAMVVAASYYSVVGPNQKATEMASSRTSSEQLLQKAWGMMSLPSIKLISLKASRLLKGASITERVCIGGVSCFVLSHRPIQGM